MIIVDSSVWIDYFNGQSSRETDFLEGLLGYEPVGVGDVILAEVLQGFRRDRDFKTARKLLMSFPLMEMLGIDRAVKCALCYRYLRRAGVTIRKTADVIVATYCLDEGHLLLYSDSDFDPFVEHLSLRSAI